MKSMHMVILGMAAVALAACSTVPFAQRQAERLTQYTEAAGAPVQTFRFMKLWSWQPLGADQLAVYTEPNKAFLLTIAGGCVNLPYATSIGVTSNMHQVSVGFDKVLTGGQDIPCMITKIQPVNLKQVKERQREQRVIDAEPRETEGSASPKAAGQG